MKGIVQRHSALIAGVVSVSLVAAWLILIHNRFFSIHEGWFSEYGDLMHQGKMPYRDFYFFTQPMHLWISWAVVGIGRKLIYIRYYGVVERIVMTAVLYVLLSRMFSPIAAACGTIASSFLFIAYATDAFFSYLYTCLFLLLVSLVFLQQSERHPLKASLWIFCSGVAASLAFFTKQSNGLLGAFAIGVAILICSTHGNGVRRALYYIAGLIGGSIPFIAWLVSNGAWDAYVREVFIGGAASKGSLLSVFFGFYRREITPFAAGLFLVIAAVMVILARRGRLRIDFESNPSFIDRPSISLGILGIATMAALVWVHPTGFVTSQFIRMGSRNIARIVFYTTVCGLAYILWRRLTNSTARSLFRNDLTALLLVSFFWSYGCGMSFSIEEQSLIPALGIALAFVFDRVRFRESSAAAKFIVGLTVVCIFVGTFQKWNAPFDWMGWREPMAPSGRHSHWREISDYHLDRADAEIFDTILDDVEKYVGPSDQLVTFPTMPMFNFVSHHSQPTFAPVHNWDVCPDDVAIRDAEMVRQLRPRMIIELKNLPWVWLDQEVSFRRGKPSGQRRFQHVIDEFAASGDYKLLREYYTPFYKDQVQVWLRQR